MKLMDALCLGLFCSFPTAFYVYMAYKAWKRKHDPPPRSTPYPEIVTHLKALGAEAMPNSRMVRGTPTYLRLRRPEGDIRFLTTWTSKSGFGKVRIGRRIQASEDPDALEYLPMVLLRRENRMDKLGKLLGINREVQTLHSDFDAGIYIESDSAWRMTERILAEPKVRDSIQRLVATQPKKFGLRMGREAVYGIWQRNSDIWRSPEKIRAAIADFDQIAENLPPVRDASTRTHFARGEDIWMLGVAASIIGWPISFILSRRWALIGEGLTGLNLNIAVLLTALSVIGIWWSIRGRPQGLRILISGTLAWFFAFWALSGIATQTYNSMGDPGAKQAIVRKVDRQMWTSSNGMKRGKRHSLYFRGARDNLKHPISLRVPRDVWENAPPGTICILEYKPGRLNRPWLTGFNTDIPKFEPPPKQ